MRQMRGVSKHKSSETLCVCLFLFNLLLHTPNRHFKKEPDKMFISSLSAYLLQRREILLTAVGGDDNQRMSTAQQDIIAHKTPRTAITITKRV